MARPDVTDVAEELYASLGPWAEEDGESNGWALLLLCDAVVRNLQPVMDMIYDQGDDPGWSPAVDVLRAPDTWLPWLSQFIGVVFTESSTPAQQRSQLQTQSGQDRGKPSVILAAVKGHLIGSQRAFLLERDTSPYHATLQTYRVQTPDADAVVAAIASNKPGGLVIDHEIIDSASFTEVQASDPGTTFADRLAAYPTFDDVLDYVP